MTTPPPLFPRREPLRAAFNADRYEEVRDIIMEDADAVHSPIAHARGQYESPLLCAIRSGVSVDILELLLLHGAPVNQRDSAGLPPLSLVASAGAPITIEMIGDAFDGGRPDGLWNPPEDEKASARPFNDKMRKLSDQRCLEYCRCLLLHGADPLWRADDGLTAAGRALESRRPSLAHFLDDWQTCRVIHAMWSRKMHEERADKDLHDLSPHENFGLLDLPFDTLGSIFSWVKP